MQNINIKSFSNLLFANLLVIVVLHLDAGQDAANEFAMKQIETIVNIRINIIFAIFCSSRFFFFFL